MAPTELMKPMKQLSLAETGFLPKAGKQTRKAVFLAEMETVVPWTRLEALIAPHYPKKGKGRPPMPLGTMLRIHFMQQWFGYSDPAMEEALHDVPLLRRFAGLDAFEDVMPDESTILRFRHLLEKHDLAVAMVAEVNAMLSEKGLSMKRGNGGRCHADRGAQFDEERRQAARPGDDADQEGQSVVLRDESPY